MTSSNGSGNEVGNRLSPEAREKLSQLAKERHRRGEFGGRKFGKLGGRPRKDDQERRAAARVAEAAQEDENAKSIIAVFRDAVDSNQPMGIRLKGAEGWLGIEREESKLALQEKSLEEEQYSREELLEILSQKLTQGPAAIAMRRQLEQENIPEAEVVDEEDGDDSASESP